MKYEIELNNLEPGHRIIVPGFGVLSVHSVENPKDIVDELLESKDELLAIRACNEIFRLRNLLEIADKKIVIQGKMIKDMRELVKHD